MRIRNARHEKEGEEKIQLLIVANKNIWFNKSDLLKTKIIEKNLGTCILLKWITESIVNKEV